VAVPDPVDFRLLSLIAEMGRAAVHDVAARLGMDPREAAARLVALSAAGMPLLVGVECDPNGIRAALAAASRPQQQQWPAYPQQQQQYGPPPMQQPQYQHPQPQYAPPPQPQYAPPPQSVPFPAQQPVAAPAPPQPAQQPQPAGGTWGPPQTSAWARGDQQTVTAAPVPPPKFVVGSTQQTVGLEGEQLSIQLVEVVDPADFLFTAAGYRLQEGERAVVVHTELTNRGTVPFSSLPDLYLLLVAADGQTVSKAPVSLSSRPPHRIGVQPGETAGGHTVYVLPDSTEITSVRWSPRPDDPQHSLAWEIEN
jgi:DNA-binding Lrp family transcriptional regulator